MVEVSTDESIYYDKESAYHNTYKNSTLRQTQGKSEQVGNEYRSSPRMRSREVEEEEDDRNENSRESHSYDQQVQSLLGLQNPSK